jgi:hypothetical protein
MIRLDPLVLHAVLDRKLTRIVFAQDASAVLTGDDYGVITVYKLRNFKNYSAVESKAASDQALALDTIVAAKIQGNNGQTQNMRGSSAAGLDS